MKKLLAKALVILLACFGLVPVAIADQVVLSPYILLSQTNTWAAAQTFGSLTDATPVTLLNSLDGSNAQSALSITPIWNTSGNPAGIFENVTNTASGATSKLLDLQVGGVSQFSIKKDGSLNLNGMSSHELRGVSGGVAIYDAGSSTNRAFINNSLGFVAAADVAFSFTNTAGNAQATQDVILVRDAANVLAQRNGTNAQIFRIYNTFTDASNYERGVMDWSSTANVFVIGTQNAGTGSARQLSFQTGSVTRWVIQSGGNLLTNADNVYSIGASGSNRPSNIFAAGYIVTGSTIVSSLPSAATAGAGAREFVTDATAPVFGSAVVGSGTVKTPVYSDGTTWIVGQNEVNKNASQDYLGGSAANDNCEPCSLAG